MPPKPQGTQYRKEESSEKYRSFLFYRYVSSIIPSGNEDLKGDEAESIIKFKKALGIDDPDAAAVHIEIGRRIFRRRLETGDRDVVIEERRAFQKLVYDSNLVFGDASTFLLPWKRVFKVTDAQVEVAVRDNAQRLFLSRLSSLGKADGWIDCGTKAPKLKEVAIKVLSQPCSSLGCECNWSVFEHHPQQKA